MRLRLLRALYQAFIISICAGMLIFASPAEAPADKSSRETAKKRTLAAIQEIGFDQHLERFELCYGIKFSFENTSNSRRQTCKAILVHDIRHALAGSGTHFKKPVRFHCQNTGKGTTRFFDPDGVAVFRLKPNKEHEAIDIAVKNHLVQSNNPAGWLKGQKACDFHIDCQKRMKWSEVNFNTINRCVFQAGAEGRQLLWDSIRSSVFNTTNKEPLMNRHIGSSVRSIGSIKSRNADR